MHVADDRMRKIHVYEKFVRPALFSLDPETAHNVALSAFKLPLAARTLDLLRVPECRNSRLSQDIMGIHFPNPVGLAAGFDKNAEIVSATAAMGFGFTEVGAITPRPQEGNPRPRLFRFPQQECLQNAMGFNNVGAAKARRRLLRVHPSVIPIGINLGKNKATSQNDAIKDYSLLIRAFKDTCDYMVINVSSPNTVGLRDLQNEHFIEEVFTMAKDHTEKPVLLKVSPDMSTGKMVYLCKAAVDSGAAGIIATNTTTDYSLLRGSKNFGGLSGPVLARKSMRALKAIAAELFEETAIISVGGIGSGKDAYERIRMGASLVKVFTAVPYKGISLVWDMSRDILSSLKRDGFETIADAIGSSLNWV